MWMNVVILGTNVRFVMPSVFTPFLPLQKYVIIVMKTVNLIFFLLILLLSLPLSGLYAQKPSGEISVCEAEIETRMKAALQVNADVAIDFLQKKILEIDNDKCKVEILLALAEAYLQKSEYAKDLYYAQKGLELANKIKYNIGSKNSHLILVDYYESKNEQMLANLHLDSAAYYIKLYSTIDEDHLYLAKKAYLLQINFEQDSAKKYLEIAITASDKNKDTATTATLLNNLGNIYTTKGNYSSATDCLLKALHYKEAIKDTAGFSSTLVALSNSFLEMRQFSTANDYLKKAKFFSLLSNQQNDLYYCYFLLAKNAQYLPTDTLQGIAYADSALHLAIVDKNEIKMADAKGMKAVLMFLKNYKVEEAETLALEAIKTFEKLDRIYPICNITFCLGRFYLEAKRYIEAEKYLRYALKIAKQRSISHLTIGLYSLLSKLYEQKGDYKTALLYHQQFYTLQDSLENGKLKSNLAELEKKYNIGKKETEIANLNKEKQLKDADLKQANTRQIFFIIISTLLAGFLFTGLWAYKKLRTNKNVLTQKNTELDNLNQVKNRLFSIIAHDVKGLAIPFQRASRILNHHIQKQNFDKTLEVAKQLETNAESLSNLLDNLLQWSLEQMNGYTPKPEMLMLKNEMAQIMETYAGHANYKNTILSENIPDTLSLETDKGAFHVIFRNLIANAITYTENGTIKINAEKEKGNIICTIKDSGNGMSANIMEKLFTIESDKIKNGTAGEKGSGLGLVLVKKFLDLNGGTIKVNSVVGKGTNFIISFPYKAAS